VSNNAHSESQVATWVIESSVLTWETQWATGTAPSPITVRMKSNNLRSGRWSLEWPLVGTTVALPPRVSPTAFS
jgi:hypothetical protein